MKSDHATFTQTTQPNAMRARFGSGPALREMDHTIAPSSSPARGPAAVTIRACRADGLAPGGQWARPPIACSSTGRVPEPPHREGVPELVPEHARRDDGHPDQDERRAPELKRAHARYDEKPGLHVHRNTGDAETNERQPDLPSRRSQDKGAELPRGTIRWPTSSDSLPFGVALERPCLWIASLVLRGQQADEARQDRHAFQRWPAIRKLRSEKPNAPIQQLLPI